MPSDRKTRGEKRGKEMKNKGLERIRLDSKKVEEEKCKNI